MPMFMARGFAVSSDPNRLEVTPSTVRSSADDMSNLASLATTCRNNVANAMVGNAQGWQESGRPGFAHFVDLLHAQADRIRDDLTFIGEQMRAAATAYEEDDEANRAALAFHHRGSTNSGS